MVVPVGAAGCQRARSQRGLTWEAVGGSRSSPERRRARRARGLRETDSRIATMSSPNFQL